MRTSVLLTPDDWADPPTRAAIRWRIAGLIAWLALTPMMLTLALQSGSQYTKAYGGAMPVVNYIGPKVWALPLLARSIGYRPEWLGATGTVQVLVVLLAITLVTAPLPSRRSRITWLARWWPIVSVGACLGMLLQVWSIYTQYDQARAGWFAVMAIVGSEAPATLLVYLHLSVWAKQVGRDDLRRRFVWLAAGTLLIILPAAWMSTQGEWMQDRAGSLEIQIAAPIYGSLSVTVGLVSAVSMLQLLVGSIWRLRATRAAAAGQEAGR